MLLATRPPCDINDRQLSQVRDPRLATFKARRSPPTKQFINHYARRTSGDHHILRS